MSQAIKVDVLVPSYRLMNASAHAAIEGAIAHAVRSGYDLNSPPVVAGSVIHWARNDAAKLIRPTADWVMFIDDDSLPEPEAITKLLATAQQYGIEILSALMVTRALPPKLCVKAYDSFRDTFQMITDVKEGAILLGEFGVGAAFLLVKHSVLKKLKEFYLSGKDWVTDNESLFKRLGVTDTAAVEAERRELEKWRRLKYKSKGGLVRYFSFSQAPEGEEFGEDMFFCRRALQLGYKIGVDTNVMVGHVADFPMCPAHLKETDYRRVKVDFEDDDDNAATRQEPS